MASCLITSRQTDGETMETVNDFILGVSKITADGDYSHEIKRCLFLGRKAMTKLDSILKNRDITLPTKVCIVKGMVLPVVMYGYESWTVKKAEPKNWFFWTVVLEKTLESPLDCKEIKPVNSKGNQPWMFTARTDAKAEAPVLWPPDAKSWLIRKYLDAGKDWRWEKGMIGWDGWRASPTWWIWVWVTSRSCWWTGKPGMLQFMGSKRVGHDWGTELKLETKDRWKETEAGDRWAPGWEAGVCTP